MERYSKQYLSFLLLLGAVFVLWSGMFRSAPHPQQAVTREAVWAYVQRKAPEYDLDPVFVFSLVKAESTFDSGARTNVARGLLQLTRGAWQTVSNKPYRHAWSWRVNLDTGMAYLAHLKEQLEAAGQFSYPRLAAAYRYGPNRLRSVDYDLSRLPTTNNRVYAAIFAGNIHPVATP